MTTSLPSSLFQAMKQTLKDDAYIEKLTKATLVHISHSLEDLVLTHQLPALIFTGFQESSHWAKESQRYNDLAQVAQQICIFAGKPLPPESTANQIHVELAEGDLLREEWFLAILTDQFSVVLCGEDQHTATTEEALRSFDTIWTFDPQVVASLLDTLEDTVRRYRPDRLAALQAARARFPIVEPDGALLSRLMMNLTVYEERLNTTLRQQNQLINNLIHSITHDVFTIDLLPDRSFVVRYTSFQIMASISSANGNTYALSTIIDEYIHKDDRRYVNQAINKLYDQESAALHLECRIYIASIKRYIWIESHITSTFDAETGIVTLYGLLKDITEQRAIKQGQQERNRLETQLTQEREINAIKTYFMNTVSHEFRTPLATILSASEILERYQERLSEEDKERRFRQIKDQVLHLSSMLDDVASIVYGQIDQLGFNPKPVDLADFIMTTVRLAEERFTQPRQIMMQFENTVNEAQVDTNLLRHILDNLLSNANKYSTEDSRIKITVKDNDQYINIIVEDEGIGIPAEDQPHIFESFYRGTNARHITGAGLGLKIAHDCARIHHGFITLTPKAQGTAFSVHIPRH
jgi:signal transduction histidine kinase